MIINNLQIDEISSEKPYSNVSAVIGVVFNTSKQLLLVKNSRGWDFPGGHLEPNESPKVALRREILEEACVTLKDPIPFLSATSERSMIFYVARINELLPFKTEHETSERTFIPISQFADWYGGGMPELAHVVLSTAVKRIN